MENFNDRAKKLLPHIGLRNIKTATAATLCALIYSFIGRGATFACIGAVFGMGDSIENSLKNGGNRLVGTTIGGMVGIAFFWFSHTLALPNLLHISLLFIGTIVLICLSQFLGYASAIQPGAVVFYIVMLNTAQNQYVAYAATRMIDTAFGVCMSVLINYVHFKLAHKASGESFKAPK